jgi:hypothetical protein
MAVKKPSFAEIAKLPAKSPDATKHTSPRGGKTQPGKTVMRLDRTIYKGQQRMEPGDIFITYHHEETGNKDNDLGPKSPSEEPQEKGKEIQEDDDFVGADCITKCKSHAPLIIKHRKFIVVFNRLFHYVCIPLFTYEGKGVNRIDVDNHVSVFDHRERSELKMQQSKWKPLETGQMLATARRIAPTCAARLDYPVSRNKELPYELLGALQPRSLEELLDIFSLLHVRAGSIDRIGRYVDRDFVPKPHSSLSVSIPSGSTSRTDSPTSPPGRIIPHSPGDPSVKNPGAPAGRPQSAAGTTQPTQTGNNDNRGHNPSGRAGSTDDRRRPGSEGAHAKNYKPTRPEGWENAITWRRPDGDGDARDGPGAHRATRRVSGIAGVKRKPTATAAAAAAAAAKGTKTSKKEPAKKREKEPATAKKRKVDEAEEQDGGTVRRSMRKRTKIGTYAE